MFSHKACTVIVEWVRMTNLTINSPYINHKYELTVSANHHALKYTRQRVKQRAVRAGDKILCFPEGNLVLLRDDLQSQSKTSG